MGLFRRTVTPRTIEQQLAELSKLGLAMNPGVVIEDLTDYLPRAKLEAESFVGVLEAFGIEVQHEPFTPICDRLWMCDFERIEDHGAYRDIIARLERLTGGALKLTEIADYVDVEEAKAWVEFARAGQRARWDLRVEDDWVDPEVFTRYDALLESSGSSIRVYTVEKDYGQQSLFAGLTPEQKLGFEKLTRLKLTSMSESAK